MRVEAGSRPGDFTDRVRRQISWSSACEVGTRHLRIFRIGVVIVTAAIFNEEGAELAMHSSIRITMVKVAQHLASTVRSSKGLRKGKAQGVVR